MGSAQWSCTLRALQQRISSRPAAVDFCPLLAANLKSRARCSGEAGNVQAIGRPVSRRPKIILSGRAQRTRAARHKGPRGEGRGPMRGPDQCGARTSGARASGARSADQGSWPVPLSAYMSTRLHVPCPPAPPLLCVPFAHVGQACQRQRPLTPVQVNEDSRRESRSRRARGETQCACVRDVQRCACCASRMPTITSQETPPSRPAALHSLLPHTILFLHFLKFTVLAGNSVTHVRPQKGRKSAHARPGWKFHSQPGAIAQAWGASA